MIKECNNCHATIEFEDSDIILEPYPHAECPVCGEWIPLF